ncbi:EAL domain-containing protein [Vibrio mexicanus]|uniref:sensor domain-containing phosphodiesterase n=1 Tax=Vibrio mexicanus TaxID=1004326 RepID=UPI00063CE752|nr:EAL domain-containing protein [Vibrio mexicanus]
MSKINTHDLAIPSQMLEGWQHIVDLLAEIINVPSALIMRIHPKDIEVVSSSLVMPNPYTPGDKESLGQGLYCETVIDTQSPLLIPNAVKDTYWCNNPDIKLGMISYCGVAINWPNGDAFGTICVLDSKENHYTDTYQRLITSFRDSIESQLTSLYQQAELNNLNRELKNRVTTRTQDLVELNYSLNQEIDRRRAAEEKIHYQKFHDVGTGFLNRRALEDKLDELIENIPITGQSIGVINVGFTNGRRIQSKHSYRVWDKILIDFRDRLSCKVNYNIVTARPSSTELALVVSNIAILDILSELCHYLVDIAQSEFDVEGEKLHLHTYIGVATSNDSRESSKLLKCAAEAMLACKDSGHKYSFYSKDISDSQTHINQLESYLLQAVRNDDLLLYFQPKVSPVTHKWTGAEALLRWRHPVLGDISNETLIHMAEQNGLIFEVGNFVLRAAIEKAAQWQNVVDDFKVAINISAIQLKNIHLAEQVEDLLNTYQLPAHYLELEVTESGLIEDEVVAKGTLSSLHNLGITLSLDDFGTGYSSFNYLKKFPFDSIKVDKSFVQQLEKSHEDREIVRSIISVAKKLNLSVTIEGIENAKHEAFILEQGCEFGQGYFYGKPMPCDEFELFLVNQNYESGGNLRMQAQ